MSNWPDKQLDSEAGRPELFSPQEGQPLDLQKRMSTAGPNSLFTELETQQVNSKEFVAMKRLISLIHKREGPSTKVGGKNPLIFLSDMRPQGQQLM